MDLDSLPLGSGVPTSVEVEELASKANDLGTAFGRQVEHFGQTIAEAKERIDAETRGRLVPKAGSAAAETTTRGQLAAIMGAADRAATEELGEFRRTVLTSSEPQRADMLDQLRTTVDRLTVMEQLYPTPVAMLSASGLGSRDRTEYLAQLSHAGPGELSTYARLALAKRDRILGAAVLSRLDQLPRDKRPFAAQEFAGKLVGDEHGTMMRAVNNARLTLSRAEAADRQLRTGASDSLSKIERGIRAKQLTGADS